jgi:stage III sporulation protein AG
MRPDRETGLKAARGILRAFEKYKYILLIVFAGVVLLLIPSFGGSEQEEETAGESAAGFSEPFSVEELEERLEQALSEIDGAGRVRVVLALRTGTEQVLARDSEASRSTDGGGTAGENKSSAVVLQRGSGIEDTVVVKQIYPEYRGAVIVCEGADSASVRLRITEAVSALTGLGTDKISISKMKER